MSIEELMNVDVIGMWAPKQSMSESALAMITPMAEEFFGNNAAIKRCW